MFRKSEGHKFGLPFGFQAREPDENDSRVEQVLAKYEFAEIFICRHEHRLGLTTLQKNRVIVNPGIEFRDKQDLMSIRTEPVNNLLIDVFVRYDLHSPTLSLG